MKRRHLLYSLLALPALLLSGCTKVAVLQPKGVIAADIKTLLIEAVLLMLVIVIPVFILTAVIARRYRASNKKAKYMPHFSHSFSLEAIWWLVPCVIIAVLATMTWRSTHKLNPYSAIPGAGKPMTIQVVALRWRWLFIYPQQHIATINFVQFPVNKQVQFVITSDAPMNSFQIPQLGGQIYAMNGMQTRLHLLATSKGDYAGRSVSFSGEHFAGMKFTARVSSQADFNRWVKTVKHVPKRLTINAYNKLVAPTTETSVVYYGSSDPGLYHYIIQKFMRPNMHTVDTSELGVHL